MATYTFYMPTIEGTVGGLIPEDISLPTLMSGDVLDLATKTITFSNKSTRKLTDEEVKSYHKHRKVIDLGGLEGTRNTLELREDGSAVYTQNTKEVVLNGSEKLRLSVVNNTTIAFAIDSIVDGYTLGGIVCDKFVTLSDSDDVEHIRLNTANPSSPVIWISQSKLTTQDVAGFKTWLQSNPVTVRYQLATPIITTIPKELIPAVLTQATNTFQFGEAVAPSKVTIQAPTTDDISKSYSITLLNGYIQTVGTATPIVNLLNTGIVRLQMDLTAPSTGMNATIFTLSTELRPITNQKIPVFVNGVCQLATIDKTTGNVNLASVPSASANIYIKTDYRRDI